MLQRNRSFGTSMERAARGLARICDLAPADAERLDEIDIAFERCPAGAAIRPPAAAPRLVWLLDGWACEACELPDGRRQIVSFAVPGDVVRLPHPTPRWTVRALTLVESVDLGVLLTQIAGPAALERAAQSHAARALERGYEQLVRLATRSPLSRIASLMIELHDRLDAEGGEFALPLRHEELADALGLSTLHVTRSLKVFRERGLFTLRFRRVSGFDRQGLLAIRDASGGSHE
ncbi:Crp/Fnr family transcriptional regulator [Phenylobacterium sp. LjRoot219]|uniref:Crp/Fnr family transcriptional regulator n=1 Tax=Phenylobacterium sp. LjRoot219 TaxID=3342283 RepID=UPI003ECFF20F